MLGEELRRGQRQSSAGRAGEYARGQEADPSSRGWSHFASASCSLRYLHLDKSWGFFLYWTRIEVILSQSSYRGQKLISQPSYRSTIVNYRSLCSSSIKYRSQNIDHQLSIIDYELSINHEPSIIKYRSLDIDHQLSITRYRPSTTINYRSTVSHQSFDINNQVSISGYRSLNIDHPISVIDYELSIIRY